MRATHSLALLVLLIGCVAGQLSFPGLHVRANTWVKNQNVPCGGAGVDYNVLNNGTSNITVLFKVLGNHGTPNEVTVSETKLYDPQDQADFVPTLVYKIDDGDIYVHSITVTVPDATVKSLQFKYPIIISDTILKKRYKTGAFDFYYCVDIQNGKYESEIAAGVMLSIPPILLVTLAVLFAL